MESENTAGQFYEPGLMRRSRRITPHIDSTEDKKVHLSHLEYRVRRNPHDLLAHVQRFSLYREQADVQACFDVLVDLFLVLGRRGLALRKRLFTQVESDLSEENRQLLQAHMETGLHHTDVLPAMSRSCLSLGISGAVNMVMPEQTEAEADIDILRFVQHLMANAQYELAQVLLEKALNENPGDVAISLQLLQLYQTRGLFQDFMLTYVRLADRNLAELALWREAEQNFRVVKSL